MIHLEDEWETDGEEYFRLKIDNLSKIKHQLNKFIKLKSKKKRKLNNEDNEELKNYFNFMNKEVYPNINIYDDKISKLKYNKEEYNVIEKPEIGTNMIFEIGKNNITYIGSTTEFYEATTKILKRSKSINDNEMENKKTTTTKRKKKILKGISKNTVINNKRKRRKITHKKNSTIKEIKKIEKNN